jgi:hypothetical protein
MAIESAVNAPRNTVLIGPASRDTTRSGVVREGPTQNDPNSPRNQSSIIRPGDAQGQQSASRFSQEQATLQEDSNSRNNRAIAAYQSFAREDRRSEVQQLLGVDTFI